MARNTIQRTPSRASSGPAGNAGKPYRGTAPTKSVAQGKGTRGGTTKRGTPRSGSSLQAGGSHSGLHPSVAAPASKPSTAPRPGKGGQLTYKASHGSGVVRGANHRTSARTPAPARHSTVSTSDLDGEVRGS